MRYLFGPIAVPMRRELSKDAELLVLRPENTVIPDLGHDSGLSGSMAC